MNVRIHHSPAAQLVPQPRTGRTLELQPEAWPSTTCLWREPRRLRPWGTEREYPAGGGLAAIAGLANVHRQTRVAEACARAVMMLREDRAAYRPPMPSAGAHYPKSPVTSSTAKTSDVTRPSS
jgi:hypothetical protein